MSDVEFHDNSPMLRFDPVTEEPESRMVQMLIRFGLATDRRSALVPLLLIAGICLTATLAIVYAMRVTSLPKSPYQPGQSALTPPQGKN